MIRKFKIIILANELKIKENRDYWLILNKLAKHKKWSPNTISNKVKELGMICFNNDKNNHPIDWLYNEYKEIKW
jgi:hypothetical protein